MNKNRHLYLFSRVSVLFLALLVFSTGAWAAQARSLADPFVPGAWTKMAGNPVLSTGEPGAWDDQSVFGPSVLLDGSTFKMWYAGSSAASSTRKIGYATSTNGATWNKQGFTPVLSPGAAGSLDEKGAHSPSVLNEGGQFKMWYTGTNAALQATILYATSANGSTWVKNPTAVLSSGLSGSWDSTFVGMTSVIKVGSGYKMWYRGGNATGGGIGYATSPDGLVWTKYAGNPVIGGGSGAWDATPYHPEAIFDGMGYHMWYSGCNQADDICQVGYATSPDGAQWTRKGMVLPQGTAGVWDGASADHAAILQVGPALKLWYSGFDGTSYRIGYASATATVLDHRLFLPAVAK